jgi:hypothetical protein
VDQHCEIGATVDGHRCQTRTVTGTPTMTVLVVDDIAVSCCTVRPAGDIGAAPRRATGHRHGHDIRSWRCQAP